MPYRRDDVIFCPTPLFHSFGLITLALGTALGATFVMPDRFDPQESLELMQARGATAASLVPVMIRRILSLPDDVKSGYDATGMRIVLASGSALGEETRIGARKLFGDVLYDLYGSTEAGWVAIATLADMRHRPSTVGRPIPGIEVAVFDPDGHRLGAGEVGELYIRSDVLFEGYTSSDGAPARRPERDGHMSIGDLGHFDHEGYLFVDGRADDMVVVGGENVYPVEIEQVIEAIDGVDEVAVLGVPDPEYGEALAAFVVGEVDKEELVDVLRRELASFKVPRRIEMVDELPRTTTGKILKRDLIHKAEQG